MNEEILNKLHAALYHISPLASDRDRIIEEMGETIWVVSLEKALSALPEDKRATVVAMMNTGDIDAVVAYMETTDVDINAIVTEVSTSVMNDVLKAAEVKE